MTSFMMTSFILTSFVLTSMSSGWKIFFLLVVKQGIGARGRLTGNAGRGDADSLRLRQSSIPRRRRISTAAPDFNNGAGFQRRRWISIPTLNRIPMTTPDIVGEVASIVELTLCFAENPVIAGLRARILHASCVHPVCVHPSSGKIEIRQRES